MQASLAIASFVAAFMNWVFTAQVIWIVGGVLIVLVVPFTLIAILPTNKKLLDSSLDRSSDLAHVLLIRWGRLHAVRTVLSLLAFAVFVLVAIPRL
jgi:uncharacterized membrane protein